MSLFKQPLFLSVYIFLYLSSLTPSSMSTTTSLSFSFSLTSLPLSCSSSSSLLSQKTKQNPSLKKTKTTSNPSYNYRSTFKYTMALIVSLSIGTPPQIQDMILDTGSQLSWIKCHNKRAKSTRPATSFDPSLSSSFSILPCNHPICKPSIPDFTLPTSCDQKRLCHYSYFYADGTLAEGDLVREKFTFSNSQVTPPLVLGCAQEASEDRGILGMNLGRLSFASQAKIFKFSYCVPTRVSQVGLSAPGSFYLGENPNTGRLQYLELLTFSQSQRMPNLDPLAYTVPMVGIRIGSTKLNISSSVFRPDSSGSGQTIIDSGSELTYLVDEAYEKVREEVVRLVGPKMKKGYVYGGVADMCFDGNALEIGRLIGDLALEFDKGIEIVVGRDRVLINVEGGVHCIPIGRSEMLGVASNIIGNVHQQNLWVEFDLANTRIGFAIANCSRSL